MMLGFKVCEWLFEVALLFLGFFQVKRKEPLDLEEGDMKRPRPSTPPDEDDEGLLNISLSTWGGS